MAGPSWARVAVVALVVGLLVGVARAPEPGQAEASSAAPVPPVSPATELPPGLPTVAVEGPLPGTPTGVLGTTRTEGLNVALTFDDGPNPGVTPALLDELGALEVAATFCVVGSLVERHPEIVARIAAEGHALCDHSATHDLRLPGRDAETVQREVVGTLERIGQAAPGAPVPYWRAPGGNWSAAVDDVARAHGMTPLGWTVDPRDWEGPGTDAVVDRILTQVRPGAVVLLHDGGGDGPDMVAALPVVVQALREAGYTFVLP
ncbi:MAG TPA: polysaccharide deacetylase family protein [Jiangellales bacterium]|nr:polysaccharide deacetylase family protein [Jiangellales bacterium]